MSRTFTESLERPQMNSHQAMARTLFHVVNGLGRIRHKRHLDGRHYDGHPKQMAPIEQPQMSSHGVAFRTYNGTDSHQEASMA